MKSARVLGSGFTIIQEGRVKLARLLAELGHNKPVDMPDISTKEKAQKYIGLDVETMKKEKAEFKKTLSSTMVRSCKKTRSKIRH